MVTFDDLCNSYINSAKRDLTRKGILEYIACLDSYLIGPHYEGTNFGVDFKPVEDKWLGFCDYAYRHCYKVNPYSLWNALYIQGVPVVVEWESYCHLTVKRPLGPTKERLRMVRELAKYLKEMMKSEA